MQKFDIYDVMEKRDSEIKKLKEQIQCWNATDVECIMVHVAFQKEIERIITNNAKFDF